MAVSLYDAKKDGVIVLADANFTGNKITSGFKGAGVLKAYAVWCPHCQDKVEAFKALASTFKKEKLGLCVYTIEADVNRKFGQAAGIESFPTILYVDEKGLVSRLLDGSKQPVYNVPEIITALCTTKKKCLRKTNSTGGGRSNGKNLKK
jgi:hypothetical protein